MHETISIARHILSDIRLMSNREILHVREIAGQAA